MVHPLTSLGPTSIEGGRLRPREIGGESLAPETKEKPKFSPHRQQNRTGIGFAKGLNEKRQTIRVLGV